MNTVSISSVTANQLLADYEQFKFGYDRYTAREKVTACTSAEQRRGWYAANRDEACASLPVDCAERLGF